MWLTLSLKIILVLDLLIFPSGKCIYYISHYHNQQKQQIMVQFPNRRPKPHLLWDCFFKTLEQSILYCSRMLYLEINLPAYGTASENLLSQCQWKPDSWRQKPSQTLSELPQTTVSNNRVTMLWCVRKDILVAMQNKWKKQMCINTFFNKIT